MNDILSNIDFTFQRIENACLANNRDPKEVRLLLATKTVTPEKISIALKAGHTLIGENKVQEIKEKYEALKNIPHETHFIGHLQSNKIKDILKFGVSCIQSVDRIGLAEKLHQRLSFEKRKIDVLIQVNTSDEASKFGVHPDKAAALVERIAAFDTIQIKGLMTIGLFSAETAQVRQCFQLLKKISDEIKNRHIPGVEMKELSMGMSGDLETAIEEGATIVRIGTAIFGKRAYPDSYYWNEGK